MGRCGPDGTEDAAGAVHDVDRSSRLITSRQLDCEADHEPMACCGPFDVGERRQQHPCHPNRYVVGMQSSPSRRLGVRYGWLIMNEIEQ